MVFVKNNNGYIKFCVDTANEKLQKYGSIEDIKINENKINKYENLEKLTEPKNIAIIDENSITDADISRAKQCVLDGRFFAEHAAAGEATRLNLGTKYLINISEDLSSEMIAKLISDEKSIHVTAEDVEKEAGCSPDDLLSIALGTRHMLQYSFDIHKLALEHGLNPKEVLSKQKMLVILNGASHDKICAEFVNLNFFGFKRENIFFMVQRSYHGLIQKDGGFSYDENAPMRLHNHGQMVMQETFDDEIFFLDGNGQSVYLKADQFGEILKEMDDKQSFCIEDLVFLNQAIDFKPLAFALKKSDDGFRMIMEIVGNNPENPQKGGMCAYDEVLGRNVIIESFQLLDIENKDIIYLNKNFNHYPKPYDSWKALKENGLNLPISVKKGHIYYQPVQGDINFLVPTEFVQNKVLTPIKNWKTPATAPLTIRYMKAQDDQDGFKDYIKQFVSL